jgi:hypothetical protein
LQHLWGCFEIVRQENDQSSKPGIASPKLIILQAEHLQPMKNIFRVFLCLLLFSGAGLNAQVVKKGTTVWSVGYGYPNVDQRYYSTVSSHADFVGNNIGPFHLKYEYFWRDKLGIGLGLNFDNFSGTWTELHQVLDSNVLVDQITTYKITGYHANLLARFNYHVYTGEKSEFYTGLGIGYRFDKAIEKSIPNDPGPQFKLAIFLPFGMDMSVGYRYFFNPRFGAYTELGFGKSILQFGACLKLDKPS